VSAVLLQKSITWRSIMWVLSVVLCAFSVLCVYLTFRHHPHPLGYLCTKFHFFRSLHCEASPWRKIVYSITHSINHPVYLRQPYQCIIYDKNGQCQHRQICVFSRLFNISFSISHRYIIKFDEAIWLITPTAVFIFITEVSLLLTKMSKL